MAVSTDAMYNAESRFLHKKYVIHFSASTTLDVTRDDCLMSSSILEDSYKLSDSPFGPVTSNELSLTLANIDGIFNPENKEGKYYGLIKKGVKIEAFIRPDEVDEWDPVGVFYVTDWYTSSTGSSAEITANDALYNVINGKVPSFPVFRDIPFSEFMTMYFEHFGLSVHIDDSIDYIIPFAYTSSYTSNKNLLSDMMLSALADCFCDHNGEVAIVSKVGSAAVRAKLTDNDQIISVSIKQSIVTSYDSSSVSYHMGQESQEQSVLSVSNVAVTPGLTKLDALQFSEQPVLGVNSIKLAGKDIVRATNFSATATDFECELQSTANTETQLDVKGTVLKTVVGTAGSLKEAPLKVDSKFIQSKDNAHKISEYIDKYLASTTPTLELKVRGNPRLNLGDLVEIDSTYYKVQAYGIIVSAKYDYVGSLSCVLTLADASGIEVT